MHFVFTSLMFYIHGEINQFWMEKKMEMLQPKNWGSNTDFNYKQNKGFRITSSSNLFLILLHVAEVGPGGFYYEIWIEVMLYKCCIINKCQWSIQCNHFTETKLKTCAILYYELR